MQVTTAQTIVWYSGFALELLVCFFAVRRKLFRDFPVFTAYLFLVAARTILMAGVYHVSGYSSRNAFYFYWTTQVLQLGMRAGAIGELAWIVSRPYPGFRAVVKWVLPGVALALLFRAASAAVPRAAYLPGFVLILERELELTAALVLCVLLLLSRRYDVEVQARVRYLAAGLLFYSLFQVANNVISQYRWNSQFHVWAVLRTSSFYVALLIWLAGLVFTEPAPVRRVLPSDLERQRKLMSEGTKAMDKIVERLHWFRR